MCVCVYIYIYMYVCACMYVYMILFMIVYMYVCIYIPPLSTTPSSHYPWLQWPRCAAVCVRVCLNIHDINKYPFAICRCKHIYIDGNACVWMDIYRYICVDIYTPSCLSRFLFLRIFSQKYFESLCKLCRCRPPPPSQKDSLCRTWDAEKAADKS